MYQEILELAIKNGLWAVLFIVLFFYILRDAASREKKYQNTIDVLSSKLDSVETIKQDVEEIKQVVVLKVNKRKKENEKI